MREIPQNKVLMDNSRGFTIIELVVVLVLIGITAVVIVPRFMSPNAFDELAARDGLIATIRAAQQAALGRENVTFAVGTSGANWAFTARYGMSTIIRSMEIPQSSVALQTGTAQDMGDDCAGTDYDDALNGFELVFDGLGNLSEFTNDGTTEMRGDVGFNGVRLCVNDTVAMSVCVSPAGYAHAGDCNE